MGSSAQKTIEPAFSAGTKDEAHHDEHVKGSQHDMEKSQSPLVGTASAFDGLGSVLGREREGALGTIHDYEINVKENDKREDETRDKRCS